MADWTPLTEDDPIPGDPVALTALVAGLRNDVQDLWTAVAQLQSINASGIWSGDAAEAFTRRREAVVPDLDRAAQRLDRAAFALETFGQAVNESQFRAHTAREQARTAQQGVTHARSQLEEVARQDAAARRAADTWAAQHPDLPAPLPPASFSPNWNGAVASGQQAMAASRLLFDQACEVYAEAENRCDKILGDAIHDELADPKKRGFLGSIGHAVGNIADHFTDLEKFSDLLGATAAICGVAAMVPGLQFLEPVALGATALKTALDVGIALHTGEGWDKVRQDAFGLGVFGIGRVATVAARGKVASQASADLNRVADARKMGTLKQFRGVTAGGPVAGSRGSRLVKNQSVKLLRRFGDDQFTGTLPSWRRSIHAMRNLDIKLPDQRYLDVSPSAVRWANRARVAKGVQEFTDALAVKGFVDPINEHPGVLARDAGSSRRQL